MMKTITTVLLTLFGIASLCGGELITISPSSDEKGSVIVRFQNTTEEEIVLMEPLDGSTIEAFQPHYAFTVKNTLGMKVDVKVLDCIPYGLWSGPKWPEEYLVRLAPGESHEVSLQIPQLNRRKGVFKVTLNYEYERGREEELGFDGIPYPTELWEGSITSNTIKVRKKKE